MVTAPREWGGPSWNFSDGFKEVHFIPSLHQCNATFENNQNHCFCQLVTPNTASPPDALKLSGMAEDGHCSPARVSASLVGPRNDLHAWVCAYHSTRTLQSSFCLRMSCPVAVLKMGSWKDSQHVPVIDSLDRFITHPKEKLQSVGGIVQQHNEPFNFVNCSN